MMQEEMRSDERRSLSWGFIDGSVSVSASMLVALLIHSCHSCAGVWFIGFLKDTSDKSAGLVVVATLLLFPTAAVIYGGVNLFFAAKEAFERRQRKLRVAAQEAGRQEGRQEGRQGRRAGKRAGKRSASASGWPWSNRASPSRRKSPVYWRTIPIPIPDCSDYISRHKAPEVKRWYWQVSSLRRE